MEPDKVIIAPLLTEKTNLQREQRRRAYTFRVDQRANKLQVMQAIKELFSVKPVSCRIMNVKPKPRSSRGRRAQTEGRTSTWKKAMVTLKEGERIEVFEGG